MENFVIEFKENSLYINGTIIPDDKINSMLRPYLSHFNRLILQAATRINHSYRTPETVAADIGKAVGVKTRMNGNSFEVWCEDGSIWKAVDTLTDSDCTECKKARLIRELSNVG